MKQIVNVGIGGRSFCMEEDAYERMNQYLTHFKEALVNSDNASSQEQRKEIMSDIEARIAELLYGQIPNPAMAVSLEIINRITGQLGMPDGSSEPVSHPDGPVTDNVQDCRPSCRRKLYRDSDNKLIGGICSGLACYFGCDCTIIRLLLLLAVIPFGFIFKFLSFFIGGNMAIPFIYIIMCIVIPVADTPAKKCEMRGIPATAENMRKFY